MAKEASIRARITQELKEKFSEKLKEDGLSESDFLIACVINYLGIETIPKLKENGGIDDEK